MDRLPFICRIVCAIAACVCIDATAAEVVLEIDFSQCEPPISKKGKGQFEGVLPKSVSEHFTWWNTSRIHSRVMSENDRRFLRLTATTIDAETPPQFVLSHPTLADGATYRLTLCLRNRSLGPMAIGVRMTDEPYSFVHQQQIGTSDAWITRTCSFTVNHKGKQNLATFIVPAALGAIDLASLRLERLQSAEEIAALVRRPDRTTRNFLRNTRFPLGMPAGWNIFRASLMAEVTTDPACVGPSGVPALRIRSGEYTEPYTDDNRVRVFGETFQVADPSAKNYVALAFRGDGEWTVNVNGGSVSQAITPTASWQRVVIPITTTPTDKAYQIDFYGRGTLWIDSLAAWAGDADRPYTSAGQCEVALALPTSKASPARIQFADEPATVAYAITGSAEGATLKSKVVDVYGHEKALRDVVLATATMAGTLRFDAIPESPLGPFRIEAWVEHADRRISPINEIVVTRVQQPIHWGQDAPQSAFGGHFYPTPLMLTLMKAAGINWARLHDAGFEYTGWWWLEPQKGTWRFFDKEIARYRDHHFHLFGQLGTAPKWASYLSRVDVGRQSVEYHDRYFQPLHLDEFANYVRVVVEKYKGVIDEWFVWNEPFYESWWGVTFDKTTGTYHTSAHPQADFAKLMQSAYTAAKSVNPSARIAGFNTAGWALGREWTRGVHEAGGLKWCDIVDYHFYTTAYQGFVGSHTDQTYSDAVGITRQKDASQNKPVYMSEGLGRLGTIDGHHGLTSPYYNTGLYRQTFPGDADDESLLKADMMARYLVNLLGLGVEKIFIYSGHCYWSLSSPSEFASLVCGDGTPHPTLAAHANIAWHLEGRPFVKTIRLADGLDAYLFAGRGRTIAAVTGRLGCAPWRVPDLGECTVRDLFGNPLPKDARYRGTLMLIDSPLDAATLAQRLMKR